MIVIIDWDHEEVVGYCGGQDVARDINNSAPEGDKVAGSKEFKCYVRSKYSDKVGPFDTEADAKTAAILLNCYHHESNGSWEAYKITTITEEITL